MPPAAAWMTMGTLFSELAPHAERLAGPRVYADANVPAGIVAFMRERLHWDVLFVMEHDDLRRAADLHHFRLARQLHRTLVTIDRDYLDDRRFPPARERGRARRVGAERAPARAHAAACRRCAVQATGDAPSPRCRSKAASSSPIRLDGVTQSTDAEDSPVGHARAAYVSSGFRDAAPTAKACCRSRHLLHAPQWPPSAGFMHDSVSSNGTPSEAPSAMTSSLCIASNGRTMTSG